MPIYEYKCKKCGERFDVYRLFTANDEKVKCPKCGANRPERQISAFSSKNTAGSCFPFRST